MNDELQEKPSPSNLELPFLFVGDHAAMDLLNTVYKTADGAVVDALKNDSDVLRWLAQVGWPVESAAVMDGKLVKTAKSLRSTIRNLVEAHRASEPLPTEPLAELNRFLSYARSHLELRPTASGSLNSHHVWTRRSPEEILAPIAESAAELFTSADFTLVKHCEDAQCVLWFIDRTKSHHRRWCSMAVCGNRNKVAAYRQRKQHQV